MAAVGGRVGVMQRSIDLSENAREIPIDLVVPQTQNSESLPPKMIIACAIALSMGIEVVLPAVDLDNHKMLEADEIHNDIVAWGLPSKVKTSLFP